MRKEPTYPTTARLTAAQRDRADAIAAVTGARRAGVVARAVELGLEQLARQVRVDEGR